VGASFTAAFKALCPPLCTALFALCLILPAGAVFELLPANHTVAIYVKPRKACGPALAPLTQSLTLNGLSGGLNFSHADKSVAIAVGASEARLDCGGYRSACLRCCGSNKRLSRDAC